ncbi:F-box/LRR-repeat protein 15 [Apostasia shenzhenica]|uniref:F-box/LRR-repeat protein 15 n=1 Tax=Apostasia shenzhenica TaxID=1088818 RepID=A0A2I0AA06_9ASPA|nr:F-box/LRR-repeat protein 15 [Apostasia shenzhenica]
MGPNQIGAAGRGIGWSFRDLICVKWDVGWLVPGLGSRFSSDDGIGGSDMAGRRLKAMAQVAKDDSDVDAGVQGGGESEELELRLSLGRWGWGGSSSMRSGRRCWLSRCDLTVGSSSSSEVLASGSRREEDSGEAFSGTMEDAALGDSGLFLTDRSDSDALERDAQHKRAKVLGPEDDAYNIASSSVASETAVLPVMEYQMVIDYFNPIPNASELRYPNSGSHYDGDGSGTSGIDDDYNRMDLTEDLLLLVFSFLSQKDLCKAGATCKQWQVASMHEEFWRCLNFEDTQISQANFETICHRYPNAREVNLFGVPDSDMLVMEAMIALRGLETLCLGKGQLGDGFFNALTDCHRLNSLSIYDTFLGNGFQEISLHHDKLRKLSIVKCRVLRVSIRCPQLKVLTLRRTNMAHALLNCPQLHELDLSSCHKLSDAGIRSAATSCPLLASLDLAFCSCVTDETLREIALSCPSLCVLDASYCPSISLESVRLPLLIDLKLHNCEGITSASISAISHSRILEALQLDNCSLLTSVSLDLPHLQTISLVHCRKFLDLNLRSPVLSYVKVSNCSLLQRINIVSNALQKLVLQKQESLANLSLQCKNLQEVDLSDCESLVNSVCEVFSNGGGCPRLKLLVLDNCESLTTVSLNNNSLLSLSLVGCRAMNVLDLSCPNLLEINLDGCDHLEYASFSPVGLETLNLGICPKLLILQIEAPKMTVLELKGCGVLSQASINCPFLISLDASFCREFLDDSLSRTAASCPQIHSLVLSSCVSIGFDGLSSLHWLQHLTLLDLSYTFLMNLQPVFDTCTQLVILKLSACKYLTDCSLDALYNYGALPTLRELDLSYSSIGQSAISDLLASCTNLVNVNLNGCVYMHQLVWDLSGFHSSGTLVDIASSNLIPLTKDYQTFRSEHRLEVLNCTGCPYIKKVIFPSMACCLHLAKLNLNLSTNLKEVDLACTNLNSLNLSHCSSLEILKLDCPRLTNLQLSGCTILAEEVVAAAISRCCLLETLNVHSCAKIHADLISFRMLCPSLKRIQSNLSA